MHYSGSVRWQSSTVTELQCIYFKQVNNELIYKYFKIMIHELAISACRGLFNGEHYSDGI